MSPTLLALVTKQHQQELSWWARCCAEGDAPSLARRWATRHWHTLISHLSPTPAPRRCCA